MNPHHCGPHAVPAVVVVVVVVPLSPPPPPPAPPPSPPGAAAVVDSAAAAPFLPPPASATVPLSHSRHPLLNVAEGLEVSAQRALPTTSSSPDPGETLCGNLCVTLCVTLGGPLFGILCGTLCGTPGGILAGILAPFSLVSLSPQIRALEEASVCALPPPPSAHNGSLDG